MQNIKQHGSHISHCWYFFIITDLYRPHLVYARVSGGPVGDAPRSWRCWSWRCCRVHWCQATTRQCLAQPQSADGGCSAGPSTADPHYYTHTDHNNLHFTNIYTFCPIYYYKSDLLRLYQIYYSISSMCNIMNLA